MRIALVDRHDLRAQRVLGRRAARARGGAACRTLGRAARMPGTQPTVEIAVRRWRDADVGQPPRGGEHVVEVHQRLAHAHEHEVVDRLDAAEVQDLVEDLRGGQVAAEPHRPGRAERARQRAAGLRGDADRAAAVAVAHQHRLDRAAVVRVEQRLDRAVARRAPRARSVERRERHVARPARARSAAGRSVISLVAARRPRPPSARPAARGRRAGRLGEGLRRGARGPSASYEWQRHAARQVPRPRRRRLAARGRAARVRRARDGRRRGRARPGARRRRGATRSPSTAAASRLASSRGVVYALNKPAGVVSTAQRPAGPPDGRRPRADAASGCTRSAGSTPTRTGLILLTNDGELAQPAHPPVASRCRESYRAHGPPTRRCASRRCAALREGVELDDGLTAPARVRRLAPDRIEITLREGRKRQVRRMCEAVGHPVVEPRARRLRAARASASSAPGRHRRAQAAPRWRSCASGRRSRAAAGARDARFARRCGSIALRGANTVDGQRAPTPSSTPPRS